jgi:peptidoglycan-N-acetylglucosamine deacetylase
MARWRNGARCAVMLTFDLDAETLWLEGDLANLKKPGLISQGTYGPNVAVPLILDLLKRRGLPATFFIPSWTIDNHPTAARAIADAGHEIGHHGYIHEHPTNLSLAEEESVLVAGIQAIERLTGTRPAGYRSPAWEFSANTVELLERYGFSYSSNLMSDIFPFTHPGTDLVELPVQWIIDDAPYFYYKAGGQRPISSAANVYQIWTEEFEGIYRMGGLYNLTMHPQLIGRPGRMLMLERVLDYIEQCPDVWFASGSEVARLWREQDRNAE